MHDTPELNPQKEAKLQESNYASHLTASGDELSATAKILCEIIEQTPPDEVESALYATRILPTPEIVQEVLKFSYGSPLAAVKFFRWSGFAHKHTDRSWNLMVDLLGRNKLFEEMWDAIRSMRQEGMLSIAAFVSAFGSYCVAGRFNEAIMTFEVMERYGVQPDIRAVNYLLSAICRQDNQTERAVEFFERIKTKIPPDADSFAIILEGWEKEGNLAKAKNTFGEMVIRVGWNPEHIPAYGTFLNTLLRGSQADEALKFLHVMKGKNCMPSLAFFSKALDVLFGQNDSAHAILLWDMMVSSGLIPNLAMYNSMIGLLCNNSDMDIAFQFLDEMVFYGAFPDSLTYNMIFQCLIKNKKVHKVSSFFIEMIKNEWPPTTSNCTEAISMLFECDDPEAAIEIWQYMADNCLLPLHDSANALLVGLCSIRRFTELRRFAEKMLNNGIEIYESTMEKLKCASCREGKNARDVYDYVARIQKSS